LAACTSAQSTTSPEKRFQRRADGPALKQGVIALVAKNQHTALKVTVRRAQREAHTGLDGSDDIGSTIGPRRKQSRLKRNRGTNMNGNRFYGVRVEGAKYGVGFGSALAIAISYTANHSILWAIIHGILGWLYVVYFALFRS
jgi:hypothetical protein